MSIFQSNKHIAVKVPNLVPIGDELMEHFREKEYEVIGEQTANHGWHISIHKGGVFKSITGTKTALNIEIEPTSTGVDVKAGVGIFGLQAVPTAISMLVFWPLLIPQIWGIVQQSKLDDEAISCVEQSLKLHNADGAQQITSIATSHEGVYCTHCGALLSTASFFCSQCGTKIV